MTLGQILFTGPASRDTRYGCLFPLFPPPRLLAFRSLCHSHTICLTKSTLRPPDTRAEQRGGENEARMRKKWRGEPSAEQRKERLPNEEVGTRQTVGLDSWKEKLSKEVKRVGRQGECKREKRMNLGFIIMIFVIKHCLMLTYNKVCVYMLHTCHTATLLTATQL